MRLKPGATARLKDTYRSKSGVLLPAIQRHVMKTQGEFNDRRSDIMHPSEMSKPDWCPRHDFYRMTGAPQDKKNSDANPSFTMENVFAVGNSIHEKWQGWCWSMGLLYGKFRCKVCHHTWHDQSPLVCPECSSNHLQYVEMPVENTEYMIAGHSDGALHGLQVGEESWDVLIEIKSIGLRTLAFEAEWLWDRYQQGESPDQIWKQITKPFLSHLRQGQFYLWLAGGRYSHIIFIYESKFNQQTKEFAVKFNPKVIEPMLVEAKEVAASIRAGRVPLRPSWATGSEARICSSCTYRSACYDIPEVSQDDQPEAPQVRVQRSTSAKRRKALRPSSG